MVLHAPLGRLLPLPVSTGTSPALRSTHLLAASRVGRALRTVSLRFVAADAGGEVLRVGRALDLLEDLARAFLRLLAHVGVAQRSLVTAGDLWDCGMSGYYASGEKAWLTFWAWCSDMAGECSVDWGGFTVGCLGQTRAEHGLIYCCCGWHTAEAARCDVTFLSSTLLRFGRGGRMVGIGTGCSLHRGRDTTTGTRVHLWVHHTSWLSYNLCNNTYKNIVSGV